MSARLFSPAAAAAFLRSSSSATGMQQTTCPPAGATQTSVLKLAAGSSPSICAMCRPSSLDVSVSSTS